jgi:hypothetical protein
MNRNLTLILALCLFFLGHGAAQAKPFGAELRLEKTIAVSELLENGDAYVGKKVQVRGLIVDVCQTRGCWMYIAGDKPFEKIRIKVNDGEIIFPLEARGQKAKVEGVVEKFVLSREEVIERRRHHAREQGEEFDASTVTRGETFYQIRGTGADIEGL